MKYFYTFLVWSALISMLFSQEQKISDIKINIESETASIIHDNQTKTTQITYFNQVVARCQEITLETDALAAEILPETTTLSCSTGITLKSPQITIKADRAKADLKEQAILLANNVTIETIKQKNNQSLMSKSTAHQVLFDLQTKNIRLLGSLGKKVTTSIQVKKAVKTKNSK